MGVTGSTQRLRPMVNPDGKVGLKVRIAILPRPVRRVARKKPPNIGAPIAHPRAHPETPPLTAERPERPPAFPRADQQASDRAAGRRTAEHQRVRDAEHAEPEQASRPEPRRDQPRTRARGAFRRAFPPRGRELGATKSADVRGHRCGRGCAGSGRAQTDVPGLDRAREEPAVGTAAEERGGASDAAAAPQARTTWYVKAAPCVAEREACRVC